MVSNDSGTVTPAATEMLHCASDLQKALSLSINHSLFPWAWTQASKWWHHWPNRGKAHIKYGLMAPWVLFGGDFSTAVSPKSKYPNPRASKKRRGKNMGFAHHQLNPREKQSTHLDQIWTPCWTEAGFSSAQTLHSFNVIKGWSNVSDLMIGRRLWHQ